MKRTFFACLTGMLLSWTITSVSYSQEFTSAAKPEFAPGELTFSPGETGAATISDPTGNEEISRKAIRNFNRYYKNVPDAKWFKLKNGFVAYFTSDGVKTRIFFNKRGKVESTIRSYFENKLPRDVRHLVKSTYYDFSIYCVDEITVDDITAYLVKIEDKTSWKTIKVINGEMEVGEEFSKR